MDYDELVSLANTEVQSSDGHIIGDLVAIHVDEGTTHARFVEVSSSGHAGHIIVPIIDASIGSHGITVSYSAHTIEDGPVSDANLTMSVGEIREVVDYYDAGIMLPGDYTIDDRSPSGSDDRDVGDDSTAFRTKNLPPVVYWTTPDHGGLE